MIAYILKLKIKRQPLHINSGNICIAMFDETIISYFIKIVVAAVQLKTDIATNSKYLIKEDKVIKDSNGVNMTELRIDFWLNDHDKFLLNHCHLCIFKRNTCKCQKQMIFLWMQNDHLDVMEYIDCILSNCRYSKDNINNDANEAGNADYSFIGLNVYNETFLMLRNFVGDCEGILSLIHPFVFVYKEGLVNYYPLKASIDYSEKNTMSWRISVHNNIITFTKHLNNTMHDLLAKYIGIRNIDSDIRCCQSINTTNNAPNI